MIGVGRIRGNALAPAITLSAVDNGGGTGNVTITWSSNNVTVSKLYDQTFTLINTAGASGSFVYAQGTSVSRTYTIVGTNSFGGSSSATVTVATGAPPLPVFTYANYVRTGFHPGGAGTSFPAGGESLEFSFTATNTTSMTVYRNGSAYTVASNALKRQTYKYSGGMQSFVVPAGVTLISVESWGAAGGRADHHGYINASVKGAGGKGAYAISTVSVTPGETIQVVVGGQGTGGFAASDIGAPYFDGDNPYFRNDHVASAEFLNNYRYYKSNNFYLMFGDYNAGPFLAGDPNVYNLHPGGYNGGGKSYGWFTASGGGASEIRKGGSALANRLNIAGGGGGGSISQTAAFHIVFNTGTAYPDSPSSIPNIGGAGGGGDGLMGTGNRCASNGRGASGSAGGLGGSGAPKSFTPSSYSQGSLGQGANGRQLKEASGAAIGAGASYGTGVWFYDSTTPIYSDGAYAEYGSGGGGGLYGGGAGKSAEDVWFRNVVDGESQADPGGGQLGFSIGPGGGGSCLADSWQAGFRSGHGLVVISYVNPLAALPGTANTVFNLDVPFSTNEGFLVRASGPGGYTDYVFTAVTNPLAALDT